MVDEQDAEAVAGLEDASIAAAAVPLLMGTDDLTADMAQAALDLAGRTGR